MSAASAQGTPIFMWAAKAEHGEPVYLFGSLHYASDACYPLPGEVQRAYADATAVGVEVDLTQRTSVELAERLGRYPNNGRLKRDVPRPLLDDVEQTVKRNGWDIERISRARPWLVAAMISGADFEAHGYQRELGTDLYFSRAAQRDGKRLVELDPLAEQFDAFNGLAVGDQVFLLRDSVKSVRSGDNARTLGQMIAAWQRGDSTGFDKLTRASLADAPASGALANTLYKVRNRKMAERIDALVRSGERLFVVVGAAHLAGPHSLLDALRERGFEVEQIGSVAPLAGAP